MAAVPTEIVEEAVGQQSQSSSPLDDEAHISLKIEDLDPNWVSNIKEKHSTIKPRRLKASSADESCSIHRVPCHIRQHNKKMYNPQMISIGPFHYKKRRHQLQAMEEHKWIYLHDILSRNGEGSLERCLVAVKMLEKSARDCYSEEINLDEKSFVEMMILDGCFIIELFRKSWLGQYGNDPIFKLGWLVPAIKADLVMFENQIPFFILECLSNLIDREGNSPHSPRLVERALHFFYDDWNFTKEDVSRHSSPLVEWALQFFCMWNLTDEKRILTREERIRSTETRIRDRKIKIQHVLHLIHSSLVSFIEEKEGEVVTIHNASKLKEGGIKIRKNINATNFLDIKFQKGVIKIPPIMVVDETNLQFLNLIAFEQCYHHCKSYITTYMSLMDCLINNVKDVEILCKYGIIDNWLGSEEDVASLFNNMGKGVTVHDESFYLSVVCDEIIKYSEKTWHKRRATLMHDYFKNPWAIISLIGAVFLLVFTMIQTFFTSFPKFAYGH